MDPFAALSFSCNVIDLVDRSRKIFNACKRIYDSADGQDDKDLHAIQHAEELIALWKDDRRNLTQTNQPDHDELISNVLSQTSYVLGDLQLVLGKCKAKKSRSIRAAAGAVLKSWKYKDDLEQHRAKLDACRRQLDSLLVSDVSQQVANITRILDQFGNTQSDIRNALQNVSHNFSTAKVKEARDASIKAKQYILARRILEALQPPGERYDTVKNAADTTYNWLFEAHYTSSKDEYPMSNEVDNSSRLEARKRFTTWLQHGTGIFHISGKPGSGKSVLMKFITEHKRTKELLCEWAEGKRLVCSKFFFWKPGDWRQNSLRGLIRGILYDVLDNQPDLVSVLFPQWSSITLQDGNTHTYPSTMTLSEKQHSAAFQKLLGSEDILEGKKICFFIDGLDELEEGHDCMYTSLVQKLRRWSDGSNGRIKMCVSSRELPEFENISLGNKIRLHELTALDIHKCVLSTLLENENYLRMAATHPEGCASLVREIVKRADGVFLWTVLVVQSILKGIANADSLSTLKGRLQAMPKQVEDLFEKIWDSIDKCYRWSVVLILAILIRQYGILLDGRSVSVHCHIMQGPEKAGPENQFSDKWALGWLPSC
ncbi:hypothetical protein F4810DRAFT_141770 [Camillea tinctor]|nr:hypothetical protein F4810DRAFT_141770 [Camillea tinctor]